MIPVSSSARIWIATGHTDMRKGMQGLSLLVQESLGRDPFAGDVFVFRGRSGSLIKALWHDGIGLSLYAKRLDRGRFVWPVTVGGVVGLTAAQMSYLLEAIDELSLKVGDGGNREGGISWGCLTPPLLHQRSDMPCPKITSSS
jgi:transposase